MRKYFSNEQETQYLYSPNPVPATLQVCRESRAESPYTAAFAVENNPRYIWVNFELDTIRMPDYALRHVKMKYTAQIRLVILEVINFSSFQFHKVYDISEMESLKELSILSVADLGVWLEYFDIMFMELDNNFDPRPEWVRPTITVIELHTGLEVNSMNVLEMSAILLRRTDSGESGYGLGLDISSVEVDDRQERRELEATQRRNIDHAVT